MDINVTLLGELITFGILVLVVTKYLWPPIMAKLEERQQIITKGIINSEKSDDLLRLTEEKTEQMIRNAKEQANFILDQAHQQALLILKEARLNAEERKKLFLNEAMEEIAYKAEQSSKQLKAEQVEILTMMLEKTLGQKLTLEMKEDFINTIIEELE